MKYRNFLQVGRTGLFMGLLIVCIGIANLGWAQAVGDFTDQAAIGDAQGEAIFQNGEYILYGDGNVGGSDDDMYFAYMEVSGSFSITGSALLYGPGHAGFMARETLEPGSKFYFTMMQDDGQAQSQYRLDDNGPAVGFTSHNNPAGYIELVRLGNTFYGYFINDNGNRVLMHKTQLDVPETIYVGIALSSQSVGTESEVGVTELEMTLYDFSAARELPQLTFTPNETIEDIEVTVKVREGTTPDLTVTEIPPAGWEVTNVETSLGETTINAEGEIEWTIDAAENQPTLTYDITAAEDATSGTWGGSCSDGTNTFDIFGDYGMSNEYLIRVYFVTSGSLDAPTNYMYKNMLSEGLTILDENGDEVEIPGLGYSVAMIDENNDDPEDALEYDIVIAHENCASGNVAEYGNIPVPYLNMEQALVGGGGNKPGYMWFGDNGSTGSGYDEMFVLEPEHPITSLWAEEEYVAVTRNDNPQWSYITWDNLALGVTPLGELQTVGGILLSVIDEGATGLWEDPAPREGFEPTPARRAFLGYHETVHVFNKNDDDGIEDISLTKDGVILVQRLVQWMVGQEVTADGTEASVPVNEWELY